MARALSFRIALTLLCGLAVWGGSLAPAATQKPKPKPPVKKPAAGAKTYAWKNVKFQSPLTLQGPDDYNGSDACNFFFPAGVKPQDDRLRICMAIVDKYGAEQLEARGPDVLVKAQVNTQLGLGIEPTALKERKILGQDVSGIIVETTFGKKRHIEAYIVKLPDGNRLFVSIEYMGTAHAAKYDALADSVTKTLALK
jgi:hypothetical protein